MGKVWVLDTETKGTGAQIVPLEKVRERPVRRSDPIAIPKVKPAPTPEPAPRGPRRFRITDVMTQRVLADRVDTRATVTALEDVRSVVDVWISTWDEAAGRWRPLMLSEQNALWELRGR